MKTLKPFFIVTDVGFVAYWVATIFPLFPPNYLYSGYRNAVVVAWNWSFFPLDMLISGTGFASLYLFSRKREEWRAFALISLTLTFCSGLQALAFWTMRREFDWQWWVMNGFLLVYPLFFVPGLIFNRSSPSMHKPEENS